VAKRQDDRPDHKGKRLVHILLLFLFQAFYYILRVIVGE